MAECLIFKNNLLHNYQQMEQLCSKNNAKLNLVTKFCISNPKIINFLVSSNNSLIISDSNMKNFSGFGKRLSSKVKKCLIKTRITDIKNLPKIKKHERPDRIFVSDICVLYELEKLSLKNKIEVVLVTEIGDLRDGLLEEDILFICNHFSSLNIIGLSANFTCLSGILPNIEKIYYLNELAQKVQKIRNLNTSFLSIGGTIVFDLLNNTEVKDLVQEVRIGEGVFFGVGSVPNINNVDFNKYKVKTFVLQGEILEVCTKDLSIQNGENQVLNALGEHFEEDCCINKDLSTKRKRAVLDFGILVSNQDDLIIADNKIIRIGQTYDFTVIDITDSKHNYKVGDKITFYMNYKSASFCMMNRFVPVFLVDELE